jgi:hypothetical protein
MIDDPAAGGLPPSSRIPTGAYSAVQINMGTHGDVIVFHMGRDFSFRMCLRVYLLLAWLGRWRCVGYLLRPY